MNNKGLDINFFIGIFLIFGILTWFRSTQVPSEDDSSSIINYTESNIDNTTELNDNDQNTTHFEDLDIDLEKESQYVLSNNILDIKISNYGASIKEVTLQDYYTYDSLELKLIQDLNFNFSFFMGEKKINSNSIIFNNVINEENKISFLYKDQQDNSLIFVYELLPDSYMVSFSVLTEEGSTYIEPNKLTWLQNANQLEKNLNNERNSTTINYSNNNKSSKQLSLVKDVQKNIEAPVWVAHKQQFFSTIISSENLFESVNLGISSPDDDSYVKSLKSEFNLSNDNTRKKYEFDLYFVPNKYSLLASFEKGFESLVPLGWGVFGWVNKFLIIPMFNFLDNFGLNYGLIILIIAVVIKLILFWPTRSSYLSMAKMRVLKPEIDTINEKIEDPVQRQQAHMNLYRKTGVNPLGGCLPMLLQMPILIALFRFFPASIELRQQSFLWADDLSTYDSILDLGFNIPLYGDHISLFAILMTLATVLQMFYSNQMSSQNAQMPQMKYVMYTMPVIFLFVMNNYSSALSYYYFLANLITFAQQAIIRNSMDDNKLYAMLQENKKKPIKKSKFQQRLEELAKKQKTK
ncbi:MAG: membrane protein insertase YidC [Flavobacteriales bacterium]|nr:membrane protein insertase YidC [Flavobacteriales bacterium]|tara:strand:+ start:2277 stop:4007 length:1731 start_codon:yes stop_codon:yes gene_type:complete